MASGSESSSRVSEYQCVKKIGKGSYGEVYLVRKKKDKKQFVMKNIRFSSASSKEGCSALQEAELLSQLKHPNIVSYHESYQDTEGVLHIIMGYCEGGDLCTRLKTLSGTLLHEDKVVEWFVQIALALQYLHERKILHRDLKTQNIFLSKHDIIKVGDLGIARVLEGSLDLAHTVVGTPYYMSPELFANKPYDFKSDVWALGCCLYEMATLNHAFSAKNISALMYKILQGKVPPLPSCFSDNLNDLVCSMLSLDAKLRPSVYQILRHDFIRVHIKQFLDKASLAKRRKSLGKPSSEATPTVNEPVNGQEKPHPSPGKVKHEQLKPIQPELSSAREKRRRSKQEGIGHRGRVGLHPRGSPSLSVKKPEDQHDGTENRLNEEDHKQILTIMDNTLHQPLAAVNKDEGSPVRTVPSAMSTQIEAIKRHCISCIGEQSVIKALMILDSGTNDGTNIEVLLKEVLLGHDELLGMLQKLQLYTKTVK